jgi:hypothetical protein
MEEGNLSQLFLIAWSQSLQKISIQWLLTIFFGISSTREDGLPSPSQERGREDGGTLRQTMSKTVIYSSEGLLKSFALPLVAVSPSLLPSMKRVSKILKLTVFRGIHFSFWRCPLAYNKFV